MKHITINSDRSVTVPVELRKIGVQYDHNVNTIEFVGPRYSGNVDLSTMTIYINYILSDKTPGKYKAENVIIDDQDDSLIRFNWTITRNVTKVSGILSCLICAKKTDEEGNEINHWNTDIFRLLSVSEGMENDLVIQEQYPDVITSIMQNIEEHNAKLLEFSGLNIRVTDLENNVDELKDDLSNKITKFYASNLGEAHITDSDDGKIQDMMLYGKSSQDGTPTTDNPVEIKSVVNPTVKIVGKNLLNATLQTITRKGVTCINNGDGTYTLNGTPTVDTDFCIYGAYDTVNRLPLDSQKTYIVKKSGHSKIQFHVGKPDMYTTMATLEDGQIKNQATISFFICRILSGTILNNFTIYPQVEEGSASTDFQPYHEQTITLPYTLNAIPVSSDGNITINGQQYIADYVNVERGKLVKMVDSSKLDNTQSIVNKTEWLLAEPQEIDLTREEVQTLKALATYYPTTNISVNSEQLDGYTVFNHPISMENGWNYVKQQIGDTRDYIYDMDTKTQDIDTQAAEAYVNSEYAVALTELEV